MANTKFPGPRYNTVPDSDRQIEVVNLNNGEWGSRRVSTDRISGKNAQTLKHTSGGSKGEG